MKRGVIPSTFLPLQSGVRQHRKRCFRCIGKRQNHPCIRNVHRSYSRFSDRTDEKGRIKFGSTCSLTVTNDCLQGIYDDIDFFRDKLILRPSEISNNPEVVRRLGLISINTAIEADIYGNINSTHIGGTKMMNGIGLVQAISLVTLSFPSSHVLLLQKTERSVPLFLWFLTKTTASTR